MWRRRPRLSSFQLLPVHGNWLRFRIERRRVGIGLGKSWTVRFRIWRRVRIGQDIRRSAGKAAQSQGRRAGIEKRREHVLWDGTSLAFALLGIFIDCSPSFMG
jgi:hypothetical protein